MRNRYLDLLRAAAIVRIVVYHLFGWPWLSLLLPAMGIMFALAGSLTAASLDKRGAGSVVGSRLRRLLPPLWLLGAITVPVMLAVGWPGFRVTELLFWILPISDPQGSATLADVWEPLWYVRAYLWFVVLSPLMYLAYRKLGWVLVALPIVAIAVLDRTGWSLPGGADAAMWDFVTYGACWVTGFAHHDGRLRRTRWWAVVLSAAALGAAALYWLHDHPGDLNDVPESQALWSLAVVLLVLRWRPSQLRLPRALSSAVTLLNNRAVTIYLWHNIAIAAVWPLLTVVALDDLGPADAPVDLAAALLLTVAAVLAFGWAEDLAARRRPRWWPTSTAPPDPASAPPSASRDTAIPEAALRLAYGPSPSPTTTPPPSPHNPTPPSKSHANPTPSFESHADRTPFRTQANPSPFGAHANPTPLEAHANAPFEAHANPAAFETHAASTPSSPVPHQAGAHPTPFPAHTDMPPAPEPSSDIQWFDSNPQNEKW